MIFFISEKEYDNVYSPIQESHNFGNETIALFNNSLIDNTFSK